MSDGRVRGCDRGGSNATAATRRAVETTRGAGAASGGFRVASGVFRRYGSPGPGIAASGVLRRRGPVAAGVLTRRGPVAALASGVLRRGAASFFRVFLRTTAWRFAVTAAVDAEATNAADAAFWRRRDVVDDAADTGRGGARRVGDRVID